MAILIPDKVDFRTKDIVKDIKGYSIKEKGSIHHEYIEIPKVYKFSNRTSKFINKKKDF